MTTDFNPEAEMWHGTDRLKRDQDRRQRLLDAALELYGTACYSATPVQAVCRLAKVSTRSFYQLYADHHELLTRLYLDLNEEVLAAIDARPLDPGQDLLTATRTLVAQVLGPMLTDDRKARVMEVETVGVSEELEQQRRLMIRRLAAALDDAFEDFAAAGLISSAPGGLTSLVLIGGITEALVQRVQSEPSEREPVADFIEQITAVIVRFTGGVSQP